MWRRLLVSGTIDKVGIIASVICAIHCLITPILLSFLPLAGVHFLEHDLHIVFVPLLVLPAVLSLLPGVLEHKRKTPVILFGIGMTIFSVGMAMHDVVHGWMETVMFMVSGVLLVIAHKLNHTYCKSCIKCECDEE